MLTHNRTIDDDDVTPPPMKRQRKVIPGAIALEDMLDKQPPATLDLHAIQMLRSAQLDPNEQTSISFPSVSLPLSLPRSQPHAHAFARSIRVVRDGSSWSAWAEQHGQHLFYEFCAAIVVALSGHSEFLHVRPPLSIHMLVECVRLFGMCY